MSEDINPEILVELRKIRTISRRMCYLIVIFIIVCAIPFFQQGRSHGRDSWEQVESAMRRQDFPAALSMARSLVLQQPDYSYGHAWLGAIYLAMDDVTNSEAEYSRAYQLFPGEEYEKDLAAVGKRMAAGASFKLLSTTTAPGNSLEPPATAPPVSTRP
jgi:cytochrome c-type biogenesis protein CcmH/NrfG